MLENYLQVIHAAVAEILRRSEAVDIYRLTDDLLPQFPQLSHEKLSALIEVAVSNEGGAAVWEKKP